ncbi:MAG: hypothetical protein IJR88_04895 [Clostridia bacterium]|nr:hypothetical protein [Clostridia bacterium]
MKKTLQIATICMLLILLVGSLVSCNQKEDPIQDDPNEAGYFEFGNHLFAVDGEVTEATLASLGTQTKEPEEAPNCAFDSQNILYSFSGFEVETYAKNGKNYFYAIYLLDDSIVADRENIVVGASKEAVIAAYGEATDAKEGSLTYEREDYSLVFFLRDGKVTRIHYLFKVQ